MKYIDFGYKDDTPAILSDAGKVITYRMLEEYTTEISSFFEQKKVVMILADWSIETVSMYYSMLRLGETAFLIDCETSQDTIIKYCELYHPDYVWGKEEKINCIGKYGVEEVVARNGYLLMKTIFSLKQIYSGLALLLTTSGSTGEAKTVRISYENIWNNTDSWTKRISITSKDRGITLLPMHHTFGLSILHICWMKGASVVLYSSSVLNPIFAKVLKEQCVTMFFGVPYTLDLIDRIGFEKIAASQMRLVQIGGAGIKEDLLKKYWHMYEKYGVSLFFSYGQTEGTTYLSSDCVDHNYVFGSVGRPLDGLKAWVDADTGELLFEGSGVSLGYAEGYKDLKQGDNNKGFLKTGDLAVIDTKGRVYIVGRLKRFVKILGERISLDEIEKILEEKFVKDEFVCVGDTDFVCIYHTGGVNEDSIVKYLDNTLRIHKQMVRAIEVDHIIRTASGKKAYEEYKL